MRFEFDNEGYVCCILYGCTTGFCVGYTGLVPSEPVGYSDMDDWANNAQTQAYYLDDEGNLAYDAERAASLPSDDETPPGGGTLPDGFAETDPTVPMWAKQPTKPKYTANEVGALPANTSIPSKTSELTNDSGYLTSLGADYVVERGVTNGWNWEKWDSGKYICWGIFQDTRAHYTLVNGFYGYYSSDFKYPITFPEPPIIHFNCKVGSGFAAPAGDVARSSSTARCYALSTASGEVACVWEMYVVGRWK